MWQRKYDRARWNGQVLHLIRHEDSRRQRLQKTDIPFRDQPHVAPLGEGVRQWQFDAVFVGPTALEDAQTLIDQLQQQPQGVLEHPWFGALELMCESTRLMVDTRVGLVTVRLQFVSMGAPTPVDQSWSETLRNDTAPVAMQLKNPFVEQIRALSQVQNQPAWSAWLTDMDKALDQLKSMANWLLDIATTGSEVSSRLKALSHQFDTARALLKAGDARPEALYDTLDAALVALSAGLKAHHRLLTTAAPGVNAPPVKPVIASVGDAVSPAGGLSDPAGRATESRRTDRLAGVEQRTRLSEALNDESVVATPVSAVLSHIQQRAMQVNTPLGRPSPNLPAALRARFWLARIESDALLADMMDLTDVRQLPALCAYQGLSLDALAQSLSDHLDQLDSHRQRVLEAATANAMVQLNAWNRLRDRLLEQRQRLKTLEQHITTQVISRPVPVQALAWSWETAVEAITGLNVIPHPLFCQGALRLWRN